MTDLTKDQKIRVKYLTWRIETNSDIITNLHKEIAANQKELDIIYSKSPNGGDKHL